MTNPSPNATNEKLRDDWLSRLRKLLEQVDAWTKELNWSTRFIEKRMQDIECGTYQAPALLLQSDTVRVLLEPISRSVPGAEGVVDLYLLPAYDDIASLYSVRGKWQIHYMFPHDPDVGNIRDAKSKPFSKDSLSEVLDQMKANAI